MKYSICIGTVESTGEGFEFLEFSAPKEKMVISSLSAADEKLYFSWTEPTSMPRLSVLDMNTQIMSLSCSDFSGGIYEPILIKDTSEITYIGHFYSENRLFRTEASLKSDFETFEVHSTKEIVSDARNEQAEINLYSNLEYEKYNPFNYMKRGIFAPLSIYNTEYFGCNSAYSTDTSTYLLGATYVTSNPWSNGENDLFIATGGWNYLNNSFGIDLQAKISSETTLLSTIIDLKNEFSDKGWKFSAAKLTTISGFSSSMVARTSSLEACEICAVPISMISRLSMVFIR